MSDGFLVLEDQKVFQGKFHGDPSWYSVGEVVFNTSLTGYQEILTDPSYFGQMILMCAPEQGNYGVQTQAQESEKIWSEGFLCLKFNGNFESRDSLESEVAKYKKPVLSGIDTRELTLHLRSKGTPWGCLVRAENKEEALKKANSHISSRRKTMPSDWVYEVSTKEPKTLKGQGKVGRVAVYDYGVKTNILRELQKRFLEVRVFNSRTPASEIMKWEPHGLMLTNGPGDPALVQSAVPEIQKLLGKLPIWGICMGHQILCLALGGKTYKLKFGHRGGNHPVKNLETGEIYMTSQNHGYATHDDLPQGVRVTQVNLYDKTVEGIRAEKLRAWSVQYHPEASPGPLDANCAFDEFREKIL